jgi:flagellar hook-basal body complex protein FliE
MAAYDFAETTHHQGGIRVSPITGASPITLALPTGSSSAVAAKGGDFSQALNKALQQVSVQQNDAEDYAKRFQLGDPNVSLERTMVALQTANVSFQALIQVRNRVIAAYQDIMNMQV